jgi:hypothetical protein
MTGIGLRASRVRKCRFTHSCPLCHGHVLVGQQEGLIGGTGWVHLDCILARQQA